MLNAASEMKHKNKLTIIARRMQMTPDELLEGARHFFNIKKKVENTLWISIYLLLLCK
jgi:hypothetical protein